MSYDLFMKPESGEFTADAFKTYFSGRNNYKLQGVQAWYENEDTGVYFLFEFQGAADAEEGEESYPVAFNMNYFRPSYFVHEAEPEVTAFINHFSMVVSDPQFEGMGKGSYQAEKFREGWNRGNIPGGL